MVKPYFKSVLNSIKLPLGFVFYTTYPFVKKLKGYLHYKTITTQNVPYEAQVKNFFVS